MTNICNEDDTVVSATNLDDHHFSVPELNQPFPPMPKIVPTFLSRAEVQQKCPSFWNEMDKVAKHCEEVGWSPKMTSLIAPRYMLGDVEPYEGFGAALVLNLPGAFEPCLTELAIQEPYVFNLDSLDKLSAQTLLSWGCTLLNGKKFCLMLPESALSACGLFDCKNNKREQVAFVQVVFIAGESVVCGGFWFDGDSIENLHATCMYSSNYRHYCPLEEDILTDAARHAELAGSPTPWEIRPWQDELGVYCMQLAVVGLREPGKEK